VTCPNCKQEMKRSEKAEYHYTACGLNYVYLLKIMVHECPKCFSQVPVIPKMQKLQEMIAKFVIGKEGKLIGEEVRFLRKHLRLMGKELAELLGVDPSTVTRWEKNESKIGAANERLLRLICKVSGTDQDFIESLMAVGNSPAPERKLEITEENDSFRVEEHSAA